MGVRHPQTNHGSNLVTVSNMREVRASDVDAADAEMSEETGDDSEEDWQPEDSEESVRGTPTKLPSLEHRSTDHRRFPSAEHKGWHGCGGSVLNIFALNSDYTCSQVSMPLSRRASLLSLPHQSHASISAFLTLAFVP